MPVLSTRRRRDPQARMPLREHLAELRSRVVRSGLAVLVGAIVGWVLYPHLFELAQEPLLQAARGRGVQANLNFADISSSFNLRLRLSVYVGLVLASPVWLYQTWAFVVPGLTSRERRFSMLFVAVAVPLFLTGIGIGWLVIPNAVGFFVDFIPTGATNLVSVESYLLFVTRVLLVFGLSFLLPLFLVALNLAGVLPARRLAGSWRVAVFLIFLFAAIAAPSPEPGSMLMLAFPMVLLYLAAVGIALLSDRRRERRRARDPLASLPDDAASPL